MTYHTKISYCKSILRVIGFLGLLGPSSAVALGVCLLVIAEALGIIEELPGMYRGTETGSVTVKSDCTGSITNTNI